MEIPVRNTIFLQGVFFSQVKTIEERMLEENNATPDAANELPIHRLNDLRITKFKNKKQWAEAYKDSTLKCWYCGLSFKGIPCFIPNNVRNTPYGKEFDARGLFCGFACAFSFLKSQSEFQKNKSYSDKLMMLKMLFTQLYNKRVVEFKEAPYVYDLTIYGGHVDIVDYRNNLLTINHSILNDAVTISKQK